MAQTKLNPYITLEGNTREAMEFYQAVFGGELTLKTFGESGAADMPDDYKDKIMHAQLESDDIVLMAADTAPGNKVEFGTNVSLSVTGDDEPVLKGYFDKLAVGGKVSEPMEKQSWGDTFGMVTDKYGFHWMVNINQATAAPGDQS